jgi:hypothetical protein
VPTSYPIPSILGGIRKILKGVFDVVAPLSKRSAWVQRECSGDCKGLPLSNKVICTCYGSPITPKFQQPPANTHISKLFLDCLWNIIPVLLHVLLGCFAGLFDLQGSGGKRAQSAHSLLLLLRAHTLVVVQSSELRLQIKLPNNLWQGHAKCTVLTSFPAFLLYPVTSFAMPLKNLVTSLV